MRSAGITLCLFLSAPAIADVISHTAYIDSPFAPGTPVGVELPLFDPALGQILTAALSWRLGPSGHARVENTADAPALFAGTLVAVTSVGSPWGSGLPPTPAGLPLGPTPLAAADGQPWQGPDYTDFGRQIIEFTFESAPRDPALLVGEGVFGCAITVESFTLEAPPQFASLINEWYLVGDVTVTYTYTPSGWSVSPLLCLGLLRLRVRSRA